MRPRGLPILLACAGVLFAGSCPAPVRPRPNVLFIAVDTLRADRLGCQGNARGLTPRLDALARSGVRFERALAHAPWTLPSFATIFSGMLPPQHGAGGVAERYFGLASGIETWPESFRAAGYETAAIVNVDFLSAEFGATQGFDALDARFSEDNALGRDARATTEAALRWLAAPREAPFLLFVHYFDPHAEYRPPQPWRERFADPRDAQDAGFRFGTREQIVGWRTGQSPIDPEAVQRAEKLYDGEVAFVDAELGRLLDELERSGLASNTLVVVTADHGEEFLEHGGVEHGHTLYRELLHVPLILAWPGRLPPAVVPRSVGLVALARTLCRLCEVPPAEGFARLDLFEAPSGPDASFAGYAFGNFWGPAWEALRDEHLAWLRVPRANARPDVHLFDRALDPGELHDLAAERAGEAARLGAEVDELRRRAQREGWRSGPPARLSDQTLERIRATGYGGDPDEDRPR